MSAKSGGPAFPALRALKSPSHEYLADVQGGMTMRDYVAIHADVPWSVVADNLYKALGHKNATFGEIAEGMATLRYLMADAMIAERAK